MRILFLSHTMPFPPDGGVFIRTYNILRQLSESSDLTIHAFDRTGRGAQARSPEESALHRCEIQKLGALTVTQIPQSRNRPRLLFDHGRSLIKSRSAVHYRYASNEYGQQLISLLEQGGWDLVHVDSLDLVRWLPDLDGQLIACTHHNVESDLLLQRAKIESNSLLRIYFERQAALTLRDEQTWCPKVALNLVVSDDDGMRISEIAPAAHIETIPNGVDTDYMTPGGDVDGSLVFVGGAGWFPNKDGFDFFCEDVLPKLRALGHNPKVNWVGRAPAGMSESYQKRFGVHLTGYVDDIRPIVRRASCYIMPIRVGGGTRLKLLDAWSMGKAVVSTTAGAAGAAAESGKNILVADEPAEFARQISRVLEDSELRNHLEANARATAEQFYSWNVVGVRLRAVYEQLLSEQTSLAQVSSRL